MFGLFPCSKARGCHAGNLQGKSMRKLSQLASTRILVNHKLNQTVLLERMEVVVLLVIFDQWH
jgi:hypothetical protein